MTRPRPGIGSELLPVLLILICLAGTLTLVVTMHRRGASARKEPAAPVAVSPPAPIPAAPSPAVVEVAPPPPEPPPPPPEDPTEKALSKLALAQAEQLREAQMADKKAAALESARQAALAESQRSRRRVALVHSQVNALTEQVTKLEADMDEILLERDVLARERDAAKAALAKARARSSYAVLPHKGQNGTWRRPIIIECHNGMATLQPNGRNFSLLELSSLLGPHSSPIVAAVAREVVRAQALSSPDGAPVVPYIFFVVRPDGIRPFYNARAHLEPLGITFGYELVDQNMEIDYPDLDNLDEWDGPVAPRPVPATPTAVAGASANRRGPVVPPRGAGGGASDVSADSFVWPARPPGGASDRGGTGDGTSGDAELPRGGPGGRPGSSGGPMPRGPAPAARNGLGRGGSGVDPAPLGVPVIDPDRPYDTPGPPAPSPGGRGSGNEPLSGPSPGTSELVPGVQGRGVEPRFGPRPGLVPVDPASMPGLDRPDAVGGHSSSPGGQPTPGGSGAAGPATDSPTGNASGNRSGSTAATELSRSVPGGPGSNPPPSLKAGQPGSVDPNQGMPPSLSPLARLAAGAGMAPNNGGTQGASGPPSSSSSLGVPLPLPAPNPEGMEPDSDTGVPGSERGGRHAGSRSDLKKPLKIDVPFELVVACGPEGVVIHPGGYRLSSKALKARDGLLVSNLKTIVQTRRQVDPMIHPHPSVRFLVEPGGSETYWDARRQTMMAGMDWPVALQVSDSSILDNFSREAR